MLVIWKFEDGCIWPIVAAFGFYDNFDLTVFSVNLTKKTIIKIVYNDVLGRPTDVEVDLKDMNFPNTDNINQIHIITIKKENEIVLLAPAIAFPPHHVTTITSEGGEPKIELTPDLFKILLEMAKNAAALL